MPRRKRRGPRFLCGKLKPEVYRPYRTEYVRDNSTRDGKHFQKDEGSTALDRLVFRKLLTVLQQYAGEEYERVWRRYHALYLGSPRPVAKVSQFERGLGLQIDEREDGGAAREFERAFELLRRRRWGREIVLALHNVVLFDQDPPDSNLFMIRRGLNLLCSHFRFRA